MRRYLAEAGGAQGIGTERAGVVAVVEAFSRKGVVAIYADVALGQPVYTIFVRGSTITREKLRQLVQTEREVAERFPEALPGFDYQPAETDNLVTLVPPTAARIFPKEASVGNSDGPPPAGASQRSPSFASPI